MTVDRGGAHGPLRYFLVGPMGAGKTAVGRALAATLELPFSDSDREVERRTGVDLRYVFEREGEDGFRRREAEAIADLIAREPKLVLATGGGAILAGSTRALLRDSGTVIHLAASVDTQLARTRRTAHRPLLDGPDPRARLESLAAVRDPLYRATAHLEVPTDGRKVQTVVSAILDALA